VTDGLAASARPPGRPRDEFVQSLERGLAVIRTFGPGAEHQSLSDVARRAGLTRAAARRFLLTLESLGYVSFDGRRFTLRPRVLELGYAYLSTLGLGEVAVPHLEQLVAATRESSSISVLDGDDVVYVVRVPTARIMTVTIAIGTRFPAHATSMGRVLLAALAPEDQDRYLNRDRFEAFTDRTVTDPVQLRRLLAEVASAGHALVDQELEEGLRSIAAPIHDARGAVVAAVNVSVHASRADLDTLSGRFLPVLLDTARHIEADLRAMGLAPTGHRFHRGENR
jgi:IclR family transcriptional regulator, pca regulon regulatory protein